MNFSFLTVRRLTVTKRSGHAAFTLFLLTAPALIAQVGNNNPGGASGIFNGQVGGCGYDPYTGNATRSITDIGVSGAVGAYPLALVRTFNSRMPSRTEVFGWAGGWNHNYNWKMEDSNRSSNSNFLPSSYTVDFPDGRVETFKSVTWDTACYRVWAANGGNTSSAGVRDRLQPHPVGGGSAYLVLPDGGKIQFQAEERRDVVGQYYYRYTANAIIDPYGLSTTLAWETTANQTRRLISVTEPSGQRNLSFAYVTPNGPRIASVTASDGRTVQYNYLYCTDCQLDNVVYYGNPNWTAHYQYCNPNVGDANPLLLLSCDDPMYAGPMKRIAYEYKPAGNNADGSQVVYGQIFRERYYDGNPNNTGNGIMVSALTIGASNPVNHNIRKESRWDGTSRTFNYNAAGYLTSGTDFMSQGASQGYDAYHYINYVIDRNGHRTDYTSDSITGNITQIQHPLTPEDTRNQGARPTVSYTYGGGAGCTDPNNQDPHFACNTTDEAGNTTTISRDTNHRVTRIDYPDGGYETFGYDSGHFFPLQTHRMATGGTESWTYDSRHRKDTYRNPDSPLPSPSPSEKYYYDALDRVSSVHDALNNATDYQYNSRNQITQVTLPTDPVNNQRQTIVYHYNDSGNNAGDGTLISVTDQLSHVTSYTYDDYRRLRSVTTPAHDNGPNTTSFYYDANGNAEDYEFTDSNVTWVKRPSGKTSHTVYDDNRQKSIVTVAPGTVDEINSTYIFDAVGNLTWVTNPRGRWVNTSYDERNRVSSINDFGRNTMIWYDTAGRKKEVDRPNGQVITNDTFDGMNRVTQQTATNTRLNGSQSIRSSYSYYSCGPANLLNTFQDPHIFSGSDQYTYHYDGMGRKTSLQYPLDGNGGHRSEQWSYDAVGRLGTFTNRDNPKMQTFSYDALNRLTGFAWNDGGTTPSVNFGYDIASRLTSINNANATISRSYFGDNLLKSETETATGGVSRVVNYTYDADGNRATIGIPGYTFNYDYTNRNQLKHIINNANNSSIATYVYDENGFTGDLTTRSVINNTSTNYSYDVYDRVTSVRHNLTGSTRTINYGYDDAHGSDNRLWVKRVISGQSPENNKGEVFSYDLADQVSAFQLNVLNPDQITQPLSQTMLYDPNGNRQFTPTAQYAAANDLSQYTTRTIAGTQTTAGYDAKGNMNTGFDSSAYSYDAQNRLFTAQKPNSPSMTFTYDGLNRQVTRTFNGTTTYSVWDGWDLVQEYHVSKRVATVDATYVNGTTGLVRDMESPNRYYYQDASGSTSHLANNNGNLVEWYRYDMDGNPTFYDATDHVRSPNQSGFSVRHLFTGQQWYQDIGLYDLRNRFYSPDFGRFLQPDPIGFKGDATNLYRYAGNNPVTGVDPTGLDVIRVIQMVGPFPHSYFGVTDGPRTIYFDYGAVNGTQAGWSVNGVRPPWSFLYGVISLTPEQDLVVRNGFYDAQLAVSQTSETFKPLVKSCGSAGADVIQDALGPLFTNFQPVDPYTGNIYNAGGDWVGWEDFNTGNIYDSDGDWADWNKNWRQNFNGGSLSFGLTTASSRGAGSPYGTFPNLSGGYGPGSYGFAWGDASWAYGQNPWGAWGNLGNFSVLASSIDARNQALWFAGNLAGQGIVAANEGKYPTGLR